MLICPERHADSAERIVALRDAWQLTGRALIVAVRTDREATRLPGTPAVDGLLTSKGTFQALLAPRARCCHDVTAANPTARRWSAELTAGSELKITNPLR